MRVASWNMNGYNARVKDGSLEALLSRRYDVVCLQETKLGSKRLPETVGGMHASWRCAEGGKNHGVCVLSVDEPLQVMDSGVSEVDSEGRLIAVELPALWVISAYSPTFIGKPDRKEYRIRYEQALRGLAGKLISSGKAVVLCGDLNVTADDKDCFQAFLWRGTPNHTDEERDAFHRLLDLGFIDTWREQHPILLRYSWMPASRTTFGMLKNYGAGFRFDYILISKALMPNLTTTDILVEHSGSDHVPVIAEVLL